MEIKENTEFTPMQNSVSLGYLTDIIRYILQTEGLDPDSMTRVSASHNKERDEAKRKIKISFGYVGQDEIHDVCFVLGKKEIDKICTGKEVALLAMFVEIVKSLKEGLSRP